MLKRHLVLDFFTIRNGWDPTLGFIVLFVIVPNFITFHLISGRGRNLVNEDLQTTRFKKIDMRLILGSIIFGVGWGVGGIDPAAMLTLFPNFFS